MKYIRYPNKGDADVIGFLYRNKCVLTEKVITIGDLLDYVNSSSGHSQVKLHWSCVKRLESEPLDRKCKTYSHERLTPCAVYDTIEVIELL